MSGQLTQHAERSLHIRWRDLALNGRGAAAGLPGGYQDLAYSVSGEFGGAQLIIEGSTGHKAGWWLAADPVKAASAGKISQNPNVIRPRLMGASADTKLELVVIASLPRHEMHEGPR